MANYYTTLPYNAVVVDDVVQEHEDTLTTVEPEHSDWRRRQPRAVLR